MDGYKMVESKRMSYIHKEQKELMSKTYSKLVKLVADPESGVTLRGKKFFCYAHIQEVREIACFVARKGLKSKDRPDAITRVFKQKHDSLMKDFKDKRYFRRLRGENKIKTAVEIDKYISTEIPDKEEDPELYQIVTDHMMHGPCGVERPRCPCSYLSACKAAWRIYGFAIHYSFPPVERLPFHLQNEQSIIFDETESLDYTVEKESVNETKFQA
ncbi:hypothetical protein Tco_0475200 [Tanacetum coccineum]